MKGADLPAADVRALGTLGAVEVAASTGTMRMEGPCQPGPRPSAASAGASEPMPLPVARSRAAV